MFVSNVYIATGTSHRRSLYFLMIVLCLQGSVAGMDSLSRKRARADDITDQQADPAMLRFKKLIHTAHLREELLSNLRHVQGRDDIFLALEEKLSVAVDRRNYEAIEQILVTMLFRASIYGNNGLVCILVEAGVPVDAFYEGRAPLHWATVHGNSETAELLIKLGANVKVEEADSKVTALHFAITRCSEKVILLLLDGGADVNAKASDGKRPLHCLVERLGHLNLYVGDTDVTTQWMNPDNRRELEVLEKKIVTGLNGRNRDRYSAEQAARKKILTDEIARRMLMITVLRAKRADVNGVDSEGRTALHYAAMNGCVGVMGELIRMGAFIDQRDASGQTPLHVASHHYHEKVVKLLVNAGANVLLVTNAENTAWDLLTHYNHSSSYKKRELQNWLVGMMNAQAAYLRNQRLQTAY